MTSLNSRKSARALVPLRALALLCMLGSEPGALQFVPAEPAPSYSNVLFSDSEDPPLTFGGDLFDDPFDDALGDMSLEALMDVDITIASRTEQELRQTPAAAYVLTGDEIRRSGHSSVAEALRMVPGFFVSRWSHTLWDVTSRGFGAGLSQTNFAYLNQLMVLIDGVVVYSPLYAGVWWSMQDVDLADIDRIEVVRGPGGFLWGSNGVRGVVHIITKSAGDTQGGRVTLRASNDEMHGSARWGGALSETGHFRAWIDYADYDTLAGPYLGIRSEWDVTAVGFRGDWHTAEGRDITVWGRTQEGDFDDIGTDLTTFEPFLAEGQKDSRTLFASLADSDAGWQLQTWWTRDRQDIPTLIDIDIDTFDLEFLNRSKLGKGHELSWGAGYRRIESALFGDDPFFLDFEPRRVDQDNFRAFVTDTIDLCENELQLILGTQVEHTEFTGFQIQPTARALWSPSEDLNFWAAASRPVRTPSLEERTLSADSVTVGNPDFDAENALIYELGARKQFDESVGIDIALFVNDYDDVLLRETDPNTFQTLISNGAEGRAYGAELALDVLPTDRWSLRSTYSYLRSEFERSSDGSSANTGGQSPKHSASIRSYYDLAEDWELDVGFYLVESLGRGLAAPDDFPTAEYDRFDARIGWRPNDSLRISFGVQNLNSALRSEFDSFDNHRRQFFFEVELTD